MNPIKLVPEEDLPCNYVELMITDACNYDCAFCGDENKAGKFGRFDYETCVQIIDKISEECNGEPFWFQITGGEPTVHPDLLEVLRYAKSKGASNRLLSNGSRTLRWWQQCAEEELLDVIFVTYHVHQGADYKHITDVVNLFHEKPTFVANIATYLPDCVDEVLAACDYFKEHTGTLICINAMDFHGQQHMKDVIATDTYDRINQYTYSFADRFETKVLPKKRLFQSNSTLYFDEGSQKVYDNTALMKDGLNQFLGWSCDIGIKTMQITPHGIYRGGCRVGRREFNIENIKFWDDPIICPKNFCYCALDVAQNKHKITN